MRLWLALLVAALPACGDDGGTPKIDGGIDAMIDASLPSFGTFVKVQFDSADHVPTAPKAFADDVDIDTASSTMCDTHNNQSTRYCVIAGTTISLASGKTLTAHGAKPLILLATTELDLDGIIDVSSKRGGQIGAGASTSCVNATESTGHSGGYGGSFGGKGGIGGLGTGTIGEAGGVPAPAVSFPSVLQGGCPGGSGAGLGGAGGAGGGAVMLFAPTIHFDGKINASGASGQGGPLNVATSNGGGGGGSGGMIIVEATTITPGASPDLWLYANGGGGGQGGTGGTATGSGGGDDGKESSAPSTPGAGGLNANRDGGSGGGGSAGTVKIDGAKPGNAVNTGGGGAGGGGGGFIHTPTITGSMIAPAAT